MDKLDKSDNFKIPKDIIKQDQQNDDKIEISSEDLIPKGKEIFFSNNQVYKKKEDIEYGKKSHLEFLNKMAANKDPLGVQSRGGLKGYTMQEIKQHNNKDSLWTVLNGNVYDLTSYLDYHPGGEKKLLQGAGRDCTSLFGKIYITFRKIPCLG
jgi:cytochrome b involved in lipid metabolism